MRRVAATQLASILLGFGTEMAPYNRSPYGSTTLTPPTFLF